ncbi:MAG: hypothetical protein ACXWFY_08180, partial [Chthoniobacterales bacterium]
AKSAFSIWRIISPCLSSAHVHERRNQGTEDNDAGQSLGFRPGVMNARTQLRWSNFTIHGINLFA